MDEKIIRSNYLETIEAHKLLIKANKQKIPKYFENLYDDTTDELNRKLNKYEKSGLLVTKYYNLIDSTGKFIKKMILILAPLKNQQLIKLIIILG